MPIADQIPTSVTNFTWSAFFGLVIAIINGSALAYWVRSRPKMREINVGAEEKLRDGLLVRVEKLERRLELKEAEHNAVVSLMRHRLNNADQCLEALLMLLKASPEKVTEAVTMIEEMRRRQREAETIERAAIQAASLNAVGATPPTA